MSHNFSINFLGGSAYGSLGGIQTYNRNLLGTLDKAGWLQACFLTNDLPAEFPLGLSGRLRGGGHSKAALAAWALRQIPERCDVFLSDHLNYSPVLAAQPRAGLKLVTLHAYEMEIPISAYRRAALKRMDGFICVSEYSRRLAIGLGLPEERLHVCHHGLDVQLDEGGVPDHDKGNVPTILFVGRLDRHYKGHDHLIAAAKILKGKGIDFSMVFAGGGERLPEFIRMAEEGGVADQVEFKGFVPDDELRRLYAKADIFALPSSGEGFGLVYLEAMANGLPCVAATAGAAPEVVMHGETGLCVEYGDVASLASALGHLLTNPDERIRFGENGRMRYAEYFSVQAFERRFCALIEDLVSGKGKGISSV